MLKITKRWLMAGVVAAGLATMLSSCTFSKTPLTPQSVQIRGLKPGEGYIVSSFHTSGIDRSGNKQGAAPGNQVLIVGPGTGQWRSPRTVLTPMVSDHRGNVLSHGFPKASEVLAIPVPAGDYEIVGWRVTGQAITANVTASNRLPIKVPFQVRAGEATYVGRVNALSIYGKNIFGMQVFAGGLVIITDEFAADQGRIADFYPSIPKSSIRKSDVPKLYMAEMKRVADTPDWTIWDMFKKKQ